MSDVMGYYPAQLRFDCQKRSFKNNRIPDILRVITRLSQDDYKASLSSSSATEKQQRLISNFTRCPGRAGRAGLTELISIIKTHADASRQWYEKKCTWKQRHSNRGRKTFAVSLTDETGDIATANSYVRRHKRLFDGLREHVRKYVLEKSGIDKSDVLKASNNPRRGPGLHTEVS
ncbi:hypothetical protein IRJ41_002610 [Triplophysa rosa]|uniref:Uncharacterized protein n=1 Tax=Triplophysa rosa TaxID=992332 RepID=A0A9W7T3I8_TRIRA|nr:hypothetical protein IRJ41_002610 [Triplophysa rosa]